jgi:hypothetical protein
VKIYTQSKSWLATFSADISRGIIAAIVATVLLTAGVLVSCLVVLSGGGSAGSVDGPTAPGSGGTSQVQQAPPTLSSIQQSDMGNYTIYHNVWSDGSTTICTVYMFPDGTQSATGNCAPDGVANGMTTP